MTGHENHGIRHAPLEGGEIHATVGSMGYISKQGNKKHFFVDPAEGNTDE